MVQLLLSNQYWQSHPEEGHRRGEDSPFSKSPAFMSQNQHPQDWFPSTFSGKKPQVGSQAVWMRVRCWLPFHLQCQGFKWHFCCLRCVIWKELLLVHPKEQHAGWLWKWHHGSWICWAKSGMYFGCMICMIHIKVDDKLYKDWNLLDWWSFDNMSKILSNFLFKKKASMESWYSYI